MRAGECVGVRMHWWANADNCKGKRKRKEKRKENLLDRNPRSRWCWMLDWHANTLAYGCVGVQMRWRADADECKEKRKEKKTY